MYSKAELKRWMDIPRIKIVYMEKDVEVTKFGSILRVTEEDISLDWVNNIKIEDIIEIENGEKL